MKKYNNWKNSTFKFNLIWLGLDRFKDYKQKNLRTYVTDIAFRLSHDYTK